MTGPLPLSEDELAEAREFYLAPDKGNECAGRVKLPRNGNPCTKCGATDNDTCGVWVRKADFHIPRLLATISTKSASIAALTEENGRLREALKPFADVLAEDESCVLRMPWLKDFIEAKAALSPGGGEG